jgi:ribose/xylose/arabinose/galactoside ABC-type transport system permease subunit
MNAALLLYAMVAALFLGQTLTEGARKRLPWNGYRVLGVALSLVWPVVLAITVVLALRESRWGRDVK